MNWSTSTAPPPLPSGGRSSCVMRNLCYSRPVPASLRPSSTSWPRTLHSSASAAGTSSRSWSARTRTGGEVVPAGAWASSRGATCSRCTCERCRAAGASKNCCPDQDADVLPGLQRARRKV